MAKFTVKDVRNGNFNKLKLQETDVYVDWSDSSALESERVMDGWKSESKISECFYRDGDQVLAVGELRDWNNTAACGPTAIYDFGMNIRQFRKLSRDEVLSLRDAIKDVVDNLNGFYFAG